jgi:hypothetical protein
MVEDLGIVGVDTAEGKDKSIVTLFKIGENGEYRPIEVIDTIDSTSFGSDVEHSGYVGVEAGELSFSAEVSEHAYDIIRMLFGWSEEFNAQGVAFKRLLKTYDDWAKWVERFYSLARKGKRRKTTYRTIRRDCAKRNRHK